MKTQTMISLNEALPSGKLFDYMHSLSFVPDALVSGYLDEEYFTNISGGKQVSPILERYYINDPAFEHEAATCTRLAAIIMNRYSTKWEALFRQYAGLETLDLLNNIEITKTTLYGKNVSHTSESSVAKSGSETNTTKLSETVEESFPTPHKSTRSISGGWDDTGSSLNTRTGTESTTETHPVAIMKTKTTEGGYSDSDTTVITRTGTETTTESFPTARSSTKSTQGGYSDTASGSTVKTGSEADTSTTTVNDSVYGFNSSSAVPSAVSNPVSNGSKTYNNVTDTTSNSLSRSYSGLTETTTESGSKQVEHALGQGMADTHSGAITRVYSGFTETETTTGTRKIDVDYGVNGLKDAGSDSSSRTYNNYTDEVTETGVRRTTTSLGNDGKTSTLTFNNRTDSHSFSEEWENSGADKVTETGHNLKSLVDEYLAIFMSANYIDFLSIVFADVDEVLTCPFYV